MGTKVIFFGGYGATQIQVGEWVTSAQKNKPNYDFEGYAYVSKSDSDVTAVRDAAKVIANSVAEINSSECEYYVVGHSSGCAISNEVAHQTRTKNIHLIVLDGYIPHKDIYPVECWYATNPPAKLRSLNADVMKNHGINPHEHQNLKALTLWALHYSLVNNNVPPTLMRNAYLAHGYDNCEAMLDYLP